MSPGAGEGPCRGVRSGRRGSRGQTEAGRWDGRGLVGRKTWGGGRSQWGAEMGKVATEREGREAEVCWEAGVGRSRVREKVQSEP